MNKLRVPIQLHNNVITCLRQCLVKAQHFFNISFDEPQIIYRQKGSIAGSAFLDRWHIQLNLAMLLENKDKFIQEVIPHELAHLIVYKKFGRVKPHGKEWQAVMETVFGCSAKRTHTFSIPDNTIQNRHRYVCQCQEHRLTNIRHKKIQQQQTQYYCKSCGCILLPKVN